ncbi:hypothetical protein L0337_07415 [candidate division KSB1 bacterium]|nr:hypothetical protein [candidate division KSB1 bacterium]
MPAVEPRLRIWMHARTHPSEVQGWWVTDEMIKLLLGETSLARLLRERCLFNIMPMYNPDGVELGLARENAHGVDIESNWNYFVSWVGSTPTQYPESWFWLNHREAVMALTYEEMRRIQSSPHFFKHHFAPAGIRKFGIIQFCLDP